MTSLSSSSGLDAFTALVGVAVAWSMIVAAMRAALAGWLAWRSRPPDRALAFGGSGAARPGDCPPITIIIPAFNERKCIVQTVRAAGRSDYSGALQIVVINDGSTDDTLGVLKNSFELELAECLAHKCFGKNVRAIHRVVVDEREILIVDKKNGGKAEALNVGISLAEGEYICAIDADTLLEPNAISALLQQFASGKNVVAVSGCLGVVNGRANSRMNGGGDPQPVASWLIDMQTIEYACEFEISRMCKQQFGLLFNVPGAIGMYRRSLLVELGGYKSDTVGEDFELIVRVHRHALEGRRPYEVRFAADAIAWTEVPDNIRDLAVQRGRWMRGALQTFARHHKMTIDPRYGLIGVCGIGSIAAQDIMAPLAYLLLAPAMLAACLTQIIDWSLPAAIAAAMVIPAFAVELSSFGVFRELLPNGSRLGLDRGRLMLLFPVYFLVYRNMLLLLRVYGIWQQLKRPAAWGVIARRGFSPCS